MALLTDEQKNEVITNFNNIRSSEKLILNNLTKTDLRNAVNAIDNFFDTNQSTINNAFPEPAKTQLTIRQKSLIVIYVITKRYGG